MDHCDVSELAEELVQVTCVHLPWSDQRVIAQFTDPTRPGCRNAEIGGHIAA
jgi:hypothetical protein